MSDLPEVRWRGGARQAASGHFLPCQPLPWPGFLLGPELAARLSHAPHSVLAGAADALSWGGESDLPGPSAVTTPRGPGASSRTQPRPEVKAQVRTPTLPLVEEPQFPHL